ncbi:hypothetical protein [Burkholderia pyrrocinia]|uniref:hypothetical protein n=1 Tax=Burkholderia pyrrocinia TaxID=60550 RepID=UPI000A8797E4|nr:hypothetical protein [Burkholderia pyrrocinia]
MEMRSLFWLSAVLMILKSGLAFANDQSFSGSWSFKEVVTGQSKPYSTFVVKINEDGAGNISGSYCFITRNGNRIDCSPDGEHNISGRAEDRKNKALVNFYSFFGATGGVAEITLEGERLLWKVVKQPKGGGYYGPNRVEMHRDDLLGYRAGERKVVAKRAFLYDSPSKSQVSRSYVIKGDSVRIINVSPDSRFWKIEFVTANGRHLVKWIDCSDIDFCAK